MKQTETNIFLNNIFQEFLNENSIKNHWRNISVGAVFAERFNRSIRGLLRKVVFEESDAYCIDVLPTITKQYNNRVKTSTNLTTTKASLQKSEVIVYQNLLDKREKIKAKFQVNDLVRTEKLKKTFPKGGTTN